MAGIQLFEWLEGEFGTLRRAGANRSCAPDALRAFSRAMGAVLNRIVPALVCFAALSAVSANAAVLNITLNSSTANVSFYSSVTILGSGGGTLIYAGEPGDDWSGDQASALAAALAYLGLPLSTPLTDIIEAPLEPFEVFDETVDASGAVYGVDYIGDPDNYLTWIAIGDADVNVFVAQLTTIFTPYALTAALVQDVSEVPLPAGGALFASALGLAAFVRRWRAKKAPAAGLAS
jgi:hypothetical protein